MSRQSLNDILRTLPSIEEVLGLLANSPLSSEAQQLPHSLKADIVRLEIDRIRQALLKGTITTVHTHDVLLNVQSHLELQARTSLRRVVNATGVLIHTNLGRSVLANEAVHAVEEVARGYSTLEYSTEAMARGSRFDHCEQLICSLTGAEAALAVNNNAAAVMMVLHEFARNKQAIISRGELIEIGGSFRIPDIMDLSDAHMVEVGTTNKTHLSDYGQAITDETALLLKVHTSNYRLIGFTESVEAKELKKLAQRVNEQRFGQTGEFSSNSSPAHNIFPSSNASPDSKASPVLVYEDLGSGLFIRPDWLDESVEPTVAEALAQGCDLVSFSGDKLLGGPQAGIIIGSKALVERLKKNPLARALRLDKMTLAALEATMRLYLNPEKALEAIPTLRMLNESPEITKRHAEQLQNDLAASVAHTIATFSVQETIARAGGGALPMFDIPSYGVEISFTQGSAQECFSYLVQKHPVPLVGRIQNDMLICDVRTLLNPDEYSELVAGLCAYARFVTSER